jgi:hypothetical protein
VRENAFGQKGKTVLGPNFLNNLLLKEDWELPVGWYACSGAVHKVGWVGTRLFTVPTLNALNADKVRSTHLLSISKMLTSV